MTLVQHVVSSQAHQLLVGYFFIHLSFHCECFVPRQEMSETINHLDKFLEKKSDQVSVTQSHQEILHKGLMRSVVKFFYDQPHGKRRVRIAEMNQRYLESHELYSDYYGLRICAQYKTDLDILIENEFKPNVARVDFDFLTWNLPQAHFDSEKFYESNKRVIELTNELFACLKAKNYEQARQLAGQLLHTIHDFYSHSNWVEMGNGARINDRIGTRAFFQEPIVSANDMITCIDNCLLIEIECVKDGKVLADLLEKFMVPHLCPLRYYNCSGNVFLLNKLLSGFNSGQQLEDGTPIQKPQDQMKCSHGGVMDSSAFIPAQGGINKDSGFYLLSPRADLHSIAADLAIKHTEYFFNQIRVRFGDKVFDDFLQLKSQFFQHYAQTCSSEELSWTLYHITLCVMLSLKLKKIQ
jgi:hypothetical protein